MWGNLHAVKGIGDAIPSLVTFGKPLPCDGGQAGLDRAIHAVGFSGFSRPCDNLRQPPEYIQDSLSKPSTRARPALG
jgi:hypothetical protein